MRNKDTAFQTPLSGEKRQKERAYEVFFEAMKGGSIENLCYAAWNFFHQPVLITDENYKLLCQYPHEKTGIYVWDTLLEKKILPQHVVEDYQTAYLEEKKKYYKPFYADTGLVADCPRIFGEIYTEEKIVGHVAVFMFDEPMQEEDLSCVQVFIDAINMLMNRRNSRNLASRDGYLLDLLKTRSTDELRFFARANLSGQIAGNYAVMVTPIGTLASDTARCAMLTSHITSAYQGAISVIYRENVVSLFGFIKSDAYTDSEKAFFSRVASFFSKSGLSSGVSEPFDNLVDVRDRFMQAELTASLSTETVTYYRDIYPAQIYEIVRRQVNASAFVLPEIKAMAAYDKENGTEYYETLRLFCYLFGNREAVARKLCIHRNTLHYRLERIRDIFGIDVENGAVAGNLMAGFRLRDLDEKIRP